MTSSQRSSILGSPRKIAMQQAHGDRYPLSEEPKSTRRATPVSFLCNSPVADERSKIQQEITDVVRIRNQLIASGVVPSSW